jgi:hypothetical protein
MTLVHSPAKNSGDPGAHNTVESVTVSTVLVHWRESTLYTQGFIASNGQVMTAGSVMRLIHVPSSIRTDGNMHILDGGCVITMVSSQNPVSALITADTGHVMIGSTIIVSWHWLPTTV